MMSSWRVRCEGVRVRGSYHQEEWGVWVWVLGCEGAWRMSSGRVRGVGVRV